MNILKALTFLLLITSFYSNANLFVEQQKDLTSLEKLVNYSGNQYYFYDTTEHKKGLTLGYTGSSFQTSVTSLKSQFLKDTLMINTSYYRNESIINTAVSIGFDIVSAKYYPSPISLGDYSLIPKMKITYTKFKNVQPSLSIDSNSILTVGLKISF